jgi:hypothetical protein
MDRVTLAIILPEWGLLTQAPLRGLTLARGVG